MAKDLPKLEASAKGGLSKKFKSKNQVAKMEAIKKINQEQMGYKTFSGINVVAKKGKR